MKCFLLAAASILLAPLVASAGFDHYVILSSTSNTAGSSLAFSPTGGDFVVSNTLMNPVGTTESTYLNFRVAFDHTDAFGNVFFKDSVPTSNTLLVLPFLFPTTASPLAQGTFSGFSEAFNLGGGNYDFEATLKISDSPGITPENQTGYLSFNFNTSDPTCPTILPGTLEIQPNFGLPPIPEPASILLMGSGMALVGVFAKTRQNRKERPAEKRKIAK